ncbi:MAG: L-sorbosone dehydrogenase [Labilithrix sp.]|nr:L-sorbosone dehydrogenase [Labilithrix sp.]
MSSLRSVLPFVAPLLAASLAIAMASACSDNGDPAAPPAPDAAVPEAAPPVDAGPDAARPDAADPSCSPLDREAGTGPKFCDLPGTDTPDLTVPDGFCAREYTTAPVPEARVLRFAPNGDVFVAAPSMDTPGGAADGLGAIVVLPDDDHDGKADATLTYAGPFARQGMKCDALEGDVANLACVHGLAFPGDGYLYFTRSDEVRRVPYAAGDRAIPTGPSELVANLGGGGRSEMRWTHTLDVDRSGALLVSRGVYFLPTCSASETEKGAVLALHIEQKGALPLTPEVVGNGFRNPMYLRCAPNSCGDCYANELTDDGWDNTGAREKVALLEPRGQSWGYPCCVGPGVLAPGVSGYDCTTAAPERVAIPLHDTPFGLDFERGLWPAPFTHGMFSAIHGVVSSFGGSGVIFMKTDPRSLRATGEAAAFVKGFRPHGRAADVAFAPDGRLFIVDDAQGRIFWVAPRALAMTK